MSKDGRFVWEGDDLPEVVNPTDENAKGVPEETPKDEVDVPKPDGGVGKSGLPFEIDKAGAEGEARDAQGRWVAGAGGAVGSAQRAGRAGALASKFKGWLAEKGVSAEIDTFAKTVATKVRDPEVIKGALGSAVNAAIGHYWLGHTDFDALMISESIQHIEVSLALSASQAKDVFKGVTDKLVSLRRATIGKAQESDEILAGLLALQKALNA